LAFLLVRAINAGWNPFVLSVCSHPCVPNASRTRPEPVAWPQRLRPGAPHTPGHPQGYGHLGQPMCPA
jgi:hypothetical protein